MGTRAVIYARRSHEGDEEQSRSVAEQLTACRDYCARKKWSVVGEFIDDGRSASRYARKVRPQFAELVGRIEAGEVGAVVAWDLDRLLRNPKELEALIDLSDKAGLRVVALGGSDIKLETSDGRFLARILVAKAAKESDDISRRTRRAKAAKAERGEPVRLHNIAAFGWIDGMTPDPKLADAIRDGARRLLAGEIGTTALAREWSEADYPRPRGGRKWSSTSVRNVMTSPRNAGLVQHQGETLGPATWPAIIDRVTHERLLVMFADPERKHGARRVTTFTGIFRCGRCGGKMYRDSSPGRGVVYRCKPNPQSDNCGRVAVSGARAEQYVTDEMFQALDTGALGTVEAAESDPAGPEAVSELAEVEQRLTDLADDYAGGMVTRAQFIRATGTLKARQESLMAMLGHGGPRPTVPASLAQPGGLAAVWSELGDADRNAVLRAVLDAVTVAPATSDGALEDRLAITWKA